MNKQLAEENKPKLLAEQQRIRVLLGFEAEYEGLGAFPGAYKPKFPEFGSGEDENANEVAEFATSLAMTTDLEKKLARIEMALQRIQDGTYGRCPQGDEIEVERLRAVPEAETCLKHAV